MNIQGLISVLPVMAEGLAGVFAVIAAVWAVVSVLNRMIFYPNTLHGFGDNSPLAHILWTFFVHPPAL